MQDLVVPYTEAASLPVPASYVSSPRLTSDRMNRSEPQRFAARETKPPAVPGPAENMPMCSDIQAATAPPSSEALFTSLYDDLRRLARREVWRNGAQGVLSTSTLVHEAWLDISQRPPLVFEEPGRFLAYAARTMRGLVIDRVRARHAQKRGGGLIITSLDTHNAEIGRAHV